MVLNQHCGLLYEQNEQEGEQTIRVTASLRIMCHVQRHVIRIIVSLIMETLRQYKQTVSLLGARSFLLIFLHQKASNQKQRGQRHQ